MLVRMIQIQLFIHHVEANGKRFSVSHRAYEIFSCEFFNDVTQSISIIESDLCELGVESFIIHKRKKNHFKRIYCYLNIVILMKIIIENKTMEFTPQKNQFHKSYKNL